MWEGRDRGPKRQKKTNQPCDLIPVLFVRVGPVDLRPHPKIPDAAGEASSAPWCRRQSLTSRSLDGRASGSLQAAPEPKFPKKNQKKNLRATWQASSRCDVSCYPPFKFMYIKIYSGKIWVLFNGPKRPPVPHPASLNLNLNFKFKFKFVPLSY